MSKRNATLILPLALTLIILLTGCSTPAATVCPCYPPAPETTKQILRQYQDKNKYPLTWAWFNKIARLRAQLEDCPQ